MKEQTYTNLSNKNQPMPLFKSPSTKKQQFKCTFKNIESQGFDRLMKDLSAVKTR